MECMATRYAFAGLLQSQFDDRALCSDPDSACSLNCDTSSDSNSFCPDNGEDVLNFFDIGGPTKWENIFILIA